jgi:hypothetical protein
MNRGRTITDLSDLVDGKLRGVQLPLQGEPKAYRVGAASGFYTLCDAHLVEFRKTETAVLTGEGFPTRFCDMCREREEP